MRLVALTALFVLSVATANAQQPPDPAFLQQAVAALQAQRNRALDEAAGNAAQLAQAQQKVADLQKQLDALKPKDKPKDK